MKAVGLGEGRRGEGGLAFNVEGCRHDLSLTFLCEHFFLRPFTPGGKLALFEKLMMISVTFC